MTCCILCSKPHHRSPRKGWLGWPGWVGGLWSTPLLQHDAEAAGFTFSGDLSQLFNLPSWLLQVCLLQLLLNMWFILVCAGYGILHCFRLALSWILWGPAKHPERGLKEGGCRNGQCWCVTVLKVKLLSMQRWIAVTSAWQAVLQVQNELGNSHGSTLWARGKTRRTQMSRLP